MNRWILKDSKNELDICKIKKTTSCQERKWITNYWNQPYKSQSKSLIFIWYHFGIQYFRHHSEITKTPIFAVSFLHLVTDEKSSL